MNSKDVFSQILRFHDDCEKVYLYGNGNIGKLMYYFLQDNGRNISGYIVTEMNEHYRTSNGLPVYKASEFLDKIGNGGVIFSLSEKYQKEINRKAFQSMKCLWMKDYQLNELFRYEYIKRTGNYRKISLFRSVAERYLENILPRINAFRYRKYNHRYDIDPWHMIPKCQKPYVKDIVNIICKLLKNQEEVIAECGCGLCDILGDRRLKKYKRYGFDVSEDVILADRDLYKNIVFEVGSFDHVSNLNISVFISVNFVHAFSEEYLKDTFNKLFKQNRIKYYIVDEVTGLYQYKHDFGKLLPDGSRLIKTLGPYLSAGGTRYIKIFDVTRI